MADAVILGAGFSKAIASQMPLANDLGRVARDAAQTKAPGLFSGVPQPGDDYPFEVWLSLLAEAQPHLDEPANRHNEALFAALLAALTDQLANIEQEVLASWAPAWLFDLVSLWHENRSNVITFNYDRLVEAAVASMHLPLLAQADIQQQATTATGPYGTALTPSGRVTPNDVLRGQPVPANPSGGLLPRGNLRSSFRLLKLHGSLDWWWVPRDPSGASFVREASTPAFGLRPRQLTDDERSIALAGRENFIVPPLATKSSYYRNPLTRQLWRDALRVLREATRIVIIGYSLPITDIVAGGLLSQATANSKVEVLVVNPAAGDVIQNLRTVLGTRASTTLAAAGSHHTEVDAFVTQELQSKERAAVAEIGSWAAQFTSTTWQPALVEFSQRGQHMTHTVRGFDKGTDGAVRLQLAGAHSQQQLNPAWPSARDVLEALDPSERLLAIDPLGHERVILNYRAPHLEDRNHTQVLYLRAAGDTG